MSKFMLSDEDAINDVNPFVTHDFSLPGGVRQMGDFEDFTEMKPTINIPVKEKSVFCSVGLCEEETKPLVLRKEVHPKRSFSCYAPKVERKVKVGVSNKSIPWRWIFLSILIIVLTLLFLRR